MKKKIKEVTRMKRRSFLGLIGGAAVAGPQVTAGSASAVADGGISASSFMPMPTASHAVEPISRRSHLLTAIADCKRRISGQQTEEEKEHQRLNDSFRQRQSEIETSTLRSMSETAKLSRLKQRANEINEDREKAYARLSLSSLMKELAGLAE